MAISFKRLQYQQTNPTDCQRQMRKHKSVISKINENHPLAKGLIAYEIFNERGKEIPLGFILNK